MAPDVVGPDGFIESVTAQALDYGSDFVFSAWYFERVAVGDDVRQLPTGWWESFDLAEVRCKGVRGLSSPHPTHWVLIA